MSANLSEAQRSTTFGANGIELREESDSSRSGGAADMRERHELTPGWRKNATEGGGANPGVATQDVLDGGLDKQSFSCSRSWPRMS